MVDAHPPVGAGPRSRPAHAPTRDPTGGHTAEQPDLFNGNCFLCGTPYQIADLRTTRQDGWLYFNAHSIVCPQCKGAKLDAWIKAFQEAHA